MAGKSFKTNNPALSYFTNEVSKPEATQQNTQEKANKKAVIKNEPKAKTQHAKSTHTSYQQDSDKNETKSKRLNLLIQPSLSKDIGKIATLRQISSNELIVRVLREFVDNQNDEIKKYDEVFTNQK